MKSHQKTFNTVRGEETVLAEVFEMDAAEAMAYEHETAKIRIEFTVNGTPRGTIFHSGNLGLDWNDTEAVTRACLAKHAENA